MDDNSIRKLLRFIALGKYKQAHLFLMSDTFAYRDSEEGAARKSKWPRTRDPLGIYGVSNLLVKVKERVGLATLVPRRFAKLAR